MRRAATFVCFAMAWVLFAPGAAFAQSAIAGIVKDTTGAVLPGVTVEVASPVLIERVRSAVTVEDAHTPKTFEDVHPTI